VVEYDHLTDRKQPSPGAQARQDEWSVAKVTQRRHRAFTKSATGPWPTKTGISQKEKCVDHACTYPRKKGEEIVLLIVDDISRISLVPLLRMSQPDSTGPGFPSTTASQPFTAPVGKTSPHIKATPIHQGDGPCTNTMPTPLRPCLSHTSHSYTLRPHPHLPRPGHTHMRPQLYLSTLLAMLFSKGAWVGRTTAIWSCPKQRHLRNTGPHKR
jgi:hypothetical protein